MGRGFFINTFYVFLGIVGVSTPVFAQDISSVPEEVSSRGLLDRIKLSTDIRVRYQNIDRPDRDLNTDALTLRVFGGAEVDLGLGFSLLGEIEAVEALVENYDDGTRPQSGREFIPDPEGVNLNRLKLVTELVPKTRATIGRQRIVLDDWRFLGSFPFRQNDQTIDGFRLETRALDFGSKSGVLDVGVFNQVNRPLGPDNIAGEFTGTSWYANYGTATPVGRLAVFHYAFDLQTSRDDNSTRTTGFRLLGRQLSQNFGLTWEGSYAYQADRGSNPRDFNVDYLLGRIRLDLGDWNVAVRGEELGAQDGIALQTPLGSLHRFSGLADQFLQTPKNGLRDLSVSLGHDFGSQGPFDRVNLSAAAHNFQDAGGDANYGTEIDIAVSARLGTALISLEHARYTAKGFSTDSRSTVVSVSYAFGN